MPPSSSPASRRSSGRPGPRPRGGRSFATLSRISAGAVFVVLLTGSAVATGGGRLACTGWPFCQPESVVGDPYLSGLQLVHRLIVAFGGALVAAVVVRSLQLQQRPAGRLARPRGSRPRRTRTRSRPGLGAAAVLAPLPSLVEVLHLAAGTGVWAMLVVIAVLAYGEPGLVLARPSTERAGGERLALGADTHLSVRAGEPMAGPLDLSVGGLAPVPVGAAAAYPSASQRGAPRARNLAPRRGASLRRADQAPDHRPPADHHGCRDAPGIAAVAERGSGRRDSRRRRARGGWGERAQSVRRPRRGRADASDAPSAPALHRATADEALVFGVALGTFAFLLLAAFVNVLAAALSLLGLLFYVFVYTIMLKRTTPQNIVIGGAAGAIPPLVGWAATRGELDLAAYLLFAIVFFWTPPHFWSLSIMTKRDYEAAGIPMLPIVAGDDEARRQILIYAIALGVISLGLYLVGRERAVLPRLARLRSGAASSGRHSVRFARPPRQRHGGRSFSRTPTSRSYSSRWSWTTC